MKHSLSLLDRSRSAEPQKTRLPAMPFLLSLLIVAALGYSGCTYYVPATLYAIRTDDTLSVALLPPGSARWDPRKDSLIVDCNGCDPAQSHVVEHFRGRNAVEFEVDEAQPVTLTLYSMGRKDTTFTLPGIGTEEAGATPRIRNMPRHRRVVVTEPSEAATTTTTTTTHTERAPTQEKTVKKVTTLKVTAPEGVAVYTDKTKTKVLKILPQGTVVPLLSREGDMISISIEGGEGFVDAEAVQIQE
jgi:hypothetical protein